MFLCNRKTREIWVLSMISWSNTILKKKLKNKTKSLLKFWKKTISFWIFSLKIINLELINRMMKSSYLTSSQSTQRRAGVKMVKSSTLWCSQRKKLKNSQQMLSKSGKALILKKMLKKETRKLIISLVKTNFLKRHGRSLIQQENNQVVFLWWNLMILSKASFHKLITFNLVLNNKWIRLWTLDKYIISELI